jgi:hypothetical protein
MDHLATSTIPLSVIAKQHHRKVPGLPAELHPHDIDVVRQLEHYFYMLGAKCPDKVFISTSTNRHGTGYNRLSGFRIIDQDTLHALTERGIGEPGTIRFGVDAIQACLAGLQRQTFARAPHFTLDALHPQMSLRLNGSDRALAQVISDKMPKLAKLKEAMGTDAAKGVTLYITTGANDHGFYLGGFSVNSRAAHDYLSSHGLAQPQTTAAAKIATRTVPYAEGTCYGPETLLRVLMSAQNAGRNGGAGASAAR